MAPSALYPPLVVSVVVILMDNVTKYQEATFRGRVDKFETVHNMWKL
jgi:hypothetical protein